MSSVVPLGGIKRTYANQSHVSKSWYLKLPVESDRFARSFLSLEVEYAHNERQSQRWWYRGCSSQETHWSKISILYVMWISSVVHWGQTWHTFTQGAWNVFAELRTIATGKLSLALHSLSCYISSCLFIYNLHRTKEISLQDGDHSISCQV